MRIMSNEGRGSLAPFQMGPTAPWDTGQAGRAQGALITKACYSERGSREGEQRATMMMDEGAAGCL